MSKKPTWKKPASPLPRAWALEARLMFDAAAVADAVQKSTAQVLPRETAVADKAVADQGGADRTVNAAAAAATTAPATPLFDVALPATVPAAAQATMDSAVRDATTRLQEWLRQPDAQAQLFAAFNGGKPQPDAAWQERADALARQIADGEFSVRVSLASAADLNGARGAFVARGPDGVPVIYVNGDWVQAGADAASLTQVLTEELGHALDTALNGDADTAGDEGEAFAYLLANGTLRLEAVNGADDHGAIRIDGQAFQAEFASYAFVNAYAMVYDLNNNGQVDSPAETAAEKEKNLHNFDPTSLGQVRVDDGGGSRFFSGNDVSATALVIGGQTYFGWISRPIKENGVVRGFYFWTDANFTSLAAAQADGNMDGDGNAADNRGFLLVVDQAWFNARPRISTGATLIDNTPGKTSYAQVGSSSDRVDTALNNLVQANLSPTANPDLANGTNGTTAAVEAGHNTPTVNAAGNVLANDTDPTADTLGVAKVGASAATQVAVSGNTTSLNGTPVSGRYGTLTMGADGSYSYAVANGNPAVDALQLGGFLLDTFTYTATDYKGGTATSTLTVRINGSNDAPTARPDYNSAKETITVSGTTYAGYNATGDVTVNDTDVDDDEANKTIAGIQTTGTAVVGTVTVTPGAATLNFVGDSGFTANLDNRALYVNVGGTYRAVYASNGTTQVTLVSKLETSTNNWTITLSAKPGSYYNAGGNVAITDLASFFSTHSGVGFEASTAVTENTSGMKTATVATATSTGTTTLTNVSGLSGTIAIGMDVGGTGVPAGTRVSDLTYTGGVLTAIRLDKELTSTAGGNFTFSRITTANQTIAGAHGTLTLNADGSYTYAATADNPYLSAGQSAVEAFGYTMQDSRGVTSSSTLYITVYGAGTNDPVAANDAASATEAGTSAGVPATGNVITNDRSSSAATPGTGLTVTEVGLAGAATTTSLATPISGTYGNLSMAANGTFTYTVNDANGTVNALAPGQSLTEVFNYKVTNGSGFTSWARLTITINGANDAPVAVADTASVQEDAPGNAVGSVLANDSDVDNNDSLSVTRAGTTTANTLVAAASTSANGQGIRGAYGDLTIGADGTYSYALDNSLAAVQALTPASTPLQDVFRYEVSDANGGKTVATLTVSITGSYEAPVNSHPAAVTVIGNTAFAFTGAHQISVADADGDLGSTTLTVDHGTLSFSGTPPSGLVVTGSGTGQLVVKGTQADINSALALLRYAPTQGYMGTDYLTILSQDAQHANDSDSVEITVGPPLTLAVSGPGAPVSEGSTALFTVTLSSVPAAATGVRLGLQDVSTQAGDYSLAKVYYLDNQGAEQALTVSGGVVTVPAGITAFHVRVTTAADSPAVFEGAESFRLTATFVDATLEAADPTADNTASATIVDDGTGTVFKPDGTPDTTATRDEDRTLTVNSISVNEASPYSVFTVTANAGQTLSLALSNGTAHPTASGNGIDYGTGGAGAVQLQYWNGLAWIDYAGAFTVPGTGSGSTTLFVRTAVHQDTTFENAEDFRLTAAYTSGSTSSAASSATGTATIRDDATGTLYTGTVTGSTPDVATGALDNDRPTVSVNSVTVSEGSPWAVLQVSLSNPSTQAIGFTPSLVSGTATAGTDTGASADLQYYNGSSWVSAAGGVTIAAGSTSVLLRTAITDDATYEGSEQLTLSTGAFTGTVTNTGAATGTITIKDDGSSTHTFPGTGTSPVPETGGADDDRPVFSVSPVKVSEGGQAYFTVTRTGASAVSQSVKVSTAIAPGDTAGSADFTAVTDQLLTFAPGVSTQTFFVQTSADTAFEGDETFTVTLSDATGGALLSPTQATARGTIADDGTGTVFKPDGTPDATATADDDRPLAVDDLSVNEASPYAVFTVTGAANQRVALSLRNGTASDADHGTALEVYDSGTGQWSAYAGSATLNALGKLLVRTTITQDSVYEGPESFALVAANTGGTEALGTAEIRDDGTGTRYPGTVTPTGAPGTDTGALDNDLGVSVTAHGPVNEASPWALFTVTATAGQTLSLALGNTADTTDRDATIAGFTPLQFSTDGSTWTTYVAGSAQPVVPGASGTGQVFVRVAIGSEQDAIYEGDETFTLTAATATGAGASGTAVATIVDSGTGSKYPGDVGTGGMPDADTSGLDNDGAPLVTTSAGAAAFTEGADTASLAIAVDPQLTVSDPDSLTLASARVAITGHFVAGQDELAFAPGNLDVGNVTASYDAATGVLALSSSGATATLAQWQAALRSVTYRNSSDTPDTATRTVSFRVNDGGLDSNIATRSVTVIPANDTPTAQPVSASGDEDTTLPVTLSGADIDGTVTGYRVTTLPQHGTLYSDAALTQAVTTSTVLGGTTLYFKPDANWSGNASFRYVAIDDGGLSSAEATASLAVAPVNDAPVARPDTLTVAEDSSATVVDVLGNDDTGPDTGETLTVTAVTQPAGGTGSVTLANGVVRFTPAPDFFGTTSFTYTVSDGNGGTATATVNVTVTPVNDAPVARPDTFTVAEDSGATVLNVLGNDDTGPDTGETLTVTAVTQPAHGGTVTLVNGVVAFTPAPDFFGTTSFTYTVSDGNGGTATATATVTVTPVNDAPVARPDTLTVAEDSGATVVDVLGNDDAGPDTGETLTVTAVTQPAHGGTVTLV
ncbi:Ig-like domain-containing protein, partial [Azohydromonas aeria]|uniref:Ig-like domain-containing protein n=1 Tax=Azohydromonas aeria TaxID=2590212 RepID=UPI0012FBA8B0